MFLEIMKERREFVWTSRKGRQYKRHGKERLIIKLKCDNCGGNFERPGHELAPHRRNNTFKHFCTVCYTPARCQVEGNEKRKENLQHLIGDKQIDSCGYMTVYVANTHLYSTGYCGRQREHILVMENHLQRSLEKGEVVHHLDGDKINNDISNLDLCSVTEHNACHGASEGIVFELYKRGQVGYNREAKRYYLK